MFISHIQVDIQALAHAVELTRQGAIDSLRFAKGDLFQAFQVISCFPVYLLIYQAGIFNFPQSPSHLLLAPGLKFLIWLLLKAQYL